MDEIIPVDILHEIEFSDDVIWLGLALVTGPLPDFSLSGNIQPRAYPLFHSIKLDEGVTDKVF